ncbi:MAG: right-handed parallel beta-helix repeat-containing protein [Ruminococcus sp.]
MLDGIYVENIGNAVIKSNRITNVNGRGIQVIASQTGKLYGNAVTGSRKCGLYVSRSKISGNKKNRLENNGSTYAIYAENSTGIISVKMPTASKITRKSVKITGKAAVERSLQFMQ